jgi:sugar/nucleoside kinase (ribokinase family)
MPAPNFVCVGGIFIDDIVYPDGRTDMGILGGGGVHTAAGMTVWDERPGLVASLGTGLPADIYQRLERDFDLRGLVAFDAPQIRAWQLFEWNGKRTEIMRVDDIEPFMEYPKPEQNPPEYRGAKGVVILRDTQEFLAWRAVFPDAVILWEPEQAYMIPHNAAEFRAALSQTDIISPNLLEASLVYDEQDPHKLIDAMLRDGAKVVALRMGEAGSLVATASERFTIPAVPVPQLVDQTGAGNAYCGAFLVGWTRGRDLRTAGYYGAVAASFVLETVGVLNLPSAQTRDDRYRWLAEQPL